MPPPRMIFRTLFSKTKKAKSKSKSKSKSNSFTRKRNTLARTFLSNITKTIKRRKILDNLRKKSSARKIQKTFKIALEKELDTDVCSICLSNMLFKKLTTTLPCGHKFHTKCLKPWLEENTCPKCRKKIVERDDDDDSSSNNSASSNTSDDDLHDLYWYWKRIAEQRAEETWPYAVSMVARWRIEADVWDAETRTATSEEVRANAMQMAEEARTRYVYWQARASEWATDAAEREANVRVAVVRMEQAIAVAARVAAAMEAGDMVEEAAARATMERMYSLYSANEDPYVA